MTMIYKKVVMLRPLFAMPILDDLSCKSASMERWISTLAVDIGDIFSLGENMVYPSVISRHDLC
jgi:hypothetical protein